MELKGVTDSTLSLFEIPSVGTIMSRPDNFLFSIIVLISIFLLFLFRRQIYDFYLNIAAFLKFPFERKFSEPGAGLGIQLAIAFVIALPLFSFSLSHVHYLNVSFFTVLLTVLIFFLMKTIVLLSVGYVSGDREIFSAVIKVSYAIFIAVSVIVFFFSSLESLLTIIPSRIHVYIALGLLTILGIFYLIELVKIIFTRKLPPFLSILYLCTFEILPVLMIVVLISRI